MKLLYRKRNVDGNNEKELSVWCTNNSWAFPVKIEFFKYSWGIQFLCLSIEYYNRPMPDYGMMRITE